MQRFDVLLGRPTLLLFYCFAFFFFLGFNSRLHCVGLLGGHDAYIAAAAIAIRLKPRPTIRVPSAVETRAVTELGQTAPSLLGQGVLGLSAPASGNTPLVVPEELTYLTLVPHYIN